MARPAIVALAFAIAALAPAASQAGVDGLQQQQPEGAGTGRRLLAVKVGGGGAVHGGMGLQEAASARLCVMQCLQHACIAWHKVYMGEADSSLAAAAAVPATAADCLLQCGMPAVESSCLAQTFHRVLNTSPLQYSCSSGCVGGLLRSACGQCGGDASSCAALRLGSGVADTECLVDAAV